MKTLASFALFLFLPLAVAAQHHLAARLDTLISKELPAGSNVAISVYDLTDKRPLYDYQADKLSRPASTMKLLTAITALARPEADEPFRTEVWHTGSLHDGILDGDLYVVGGYDPEFDEEALDSLARQIARHPVREIRGHIYGDISLKDSLYWGSGWAWDDNPAYYQPYLSPLMLCKGVVTVTARPGERGDTARLECHPASTYYKVINRTVTRAPEAGRFRVSRNWLENGNDLMISGSVDCERSGDVNICPSQDLFMHCLVERLRALEIACPEEYAYAELPRDTFPSGLIARYETPIQAVLDQLMKESDNLNAEAMLCRLGAQATGQRHISASAGLSAIRRQIKSLGLDPDHYNLADGSGLSNYNYVSPELLVAFLRFAYDRTGIFRRLYKALPVGGVDGTLKNRMKQGTPSYRRVHAKTGSFTGINCLAGYLQADNGHQIAFAIMNQNVLSGREARNFQDRVCDEIIKERF